MASLRDQLRSIYEQHGKLTPAIVLDEARDEEHPLHSRFEWDDTVAAEQYRHHQAQQLIRSVKVHFVTADGPRDVRAFIAVPEEDKASSRYEPVEEAIADPMTRRIILRDMEREWRAFQARYSHMAEFADMIRASLEETAA